MSDRARTGNLRRLRRFGIVAGIALGSTALVASVAGAAPAHSAAPTAAAPSTSKVLPAGAVRVNHVTPKLGEQGNSLFQKAPTGSAHPDIVGGSPAQSSQYPSVVGVETIFLGGYESDGTPDWYEVICTGTILSPTKVLTAGHCASDLVDSTGTYLDATTYVLAGQNTLDITGSNGGFIDGVSSTWTDPTFNLAALNSGTAPHGVPTDDLAELTLTVPLPSAYTPVSLTAQGDNTPYAANTNAVVVGYGVTDNTDNNAGTLNAATIQVQSDSTCASAMPGYSATTMTCAGINPNGGIDTCHGDSGGPMYVNGVEAGLIDWGSATGCALAGTYGVNERISNYHNTIVAAENQPPVQDMSFSGDGHTSILARNSAGALIEYDGTGFANDGYNGFSGSYVLSSSGWNAYSTLFRVTDWNGDGTESIMAETPSGGLYEYDTNGIGDFTSGTPAQVGQGWNVFNDIMVVNNWTGDGRADLIGRKADGTLWLYESTGGGTWLHPNGVQIGQGWGIFNTIITPGTWTGDGHQTLIGRTTAGALRLYESNGSNGWTNPAGVQIGQGWNEFSSMFSLGDWSGDGLVDMFGVTPGGTMDLYDTDGHGNWLNPSGQTIGQGWQSLTAIF